MKEKGDPTKELDPDHGHQDIGTSTYRCSVTSKDRKVVWRNFDSITANMGIQRELIRTQVKENEEGRIQLEELIDPALVILSDITKEHLDMDVLNNVKNSMVDSYQTTKWIFHEILDLKHRMSTMEREIYSLKNKVKEDDQNMERRVEEVSNRVIELDRDM